MTACSAILRTPISTATITNSTTTAKSLYYMGLVLNALGDAKEAKAAARAKTYFASVKNHFASTTWAAKARRELNR